MKNSYEAELYFEAINALNIVFVYITSYVHTDFSVVKPFMPILYRWSVNL